MYRNSVGKLIDCRYMTKILLLWRKTPAQANKQHIFLWRTLENEPRHEKTWFCHMRTIKVHISLRIRAG